MQAKNPTRISGVVQVGRPTLTTKSLPNGNTYYEITALVLPYWGDMPKAPGLRWTIARGEGDRTESELLDAWATVLSQDVAIYGYQGSLEGFPYRAAGEVRGAA